VGHQYSTRKKRWDHDYHLPVFDSARRGYPGRRFPEGPKPGVGECPGENEGGRPHLDYRDPRLRPQLYQVDSDTNRPIRFGEAYYDTQSQYYNLTAGEINIDNQDKSKSSGVLYPAAQLTIGSDGQFTLDLNKNPWRLGNIIDWAGTPGEN
jgi:hypothetical protein